MSYWQTLVYTWAIELDTFSKFLQVHSRFFLWGDRYDCWMNYLLLEKERTVLLWHFWSSWLPVVPVIKVKTKISLVRQSIVFFSEGTILPWLDCGEAIAIWKKSGHCLPAPLKQQSTNSISLLRSVPAWCQRMLPCFWTAASLVSVQVSVVVGAGLKWFTHSGYEQGLFTLSCKQRLAH